MLRYKKSTLVQAVTMTIIDGYYLVYLVHNQSLG